jgi:hypothetical protein
MKKRSKTSRRERRASVKLNSAEVFIEEIRERRRALWKECGNDPARVAAIGQKVMLERATKQRSLKSRSS